MLAARIYTTDWEVDERLASVFKTTRDEWIHVVREVVGARADSVEDDPRTTPGQFAYIHGTRNVRGLLRSKGWLNFRHENIEAVEHPERDLKVIYQNVDIASAIRDPRPISSKRSGSERFIDEYCGSLFSEEELRAMTGTHTGGITTGAWYFCVSVNEEDVRAELSLPTGVIGGNFAGFAERIFILRPGDWSKMIEKDHSGSGSGPDAADFEPIVKRKSNVQSCKA